jgi:hypothetical protein
MPEKSSVDKQPEQQQVLLYGQRVADKRNQELIKPQPVQVTADGKLQVQVPPAHWFKL